MAFSLSQRLVRETARTAARTAQTNVTTVTAAIDALSDSINATGIKNGVVLIQAEDERTRAIYAFPEGYSPANALEVVDAVRQYCAGLDAAGVLAQLAADYAVKRQRVTAISTVGMPL